MATYNGTNDDDNFVGTSDGDTFNMIAQPLGVDTLDGTGGRDTLNLDYSSPSFTNGWGSTITSNGAGGFDGTIWTSPGYRTIFTSLEVLNLRLTDGPDSIDIDGASLVAGAVLNIDAGNNDFYIDTISLDLSTLGDTILDASAGGTVTTNIAGLTISNFESYGVRFGDGTNSFVGAGASDYITTGLGSNTISTGAGSDYVESHGGVDVVNGGDDDDNWVGDYSAATANLDFLYDASGGAGSLTGGTTLTSIEGVSLVTGAGDDSFTLTGGANWDTLDGGAGEDSLTIDDFGTASLSTLFNVVRIAANGGSGFDGSIDGTDKHILNFEHVDITGPDNDNVFVADAAPLQAGATLRLAGGGGVDWISLNLRTFANISFSAAAGGVVTNNITGLQLASFENYVLALGSGSNNVTTFNGNDVIVSGSGDDTLDAGLGTDTLNYQLATSGVSVNLAVTAAQATGGAGTDTIAGFENLTGSAFGDHLTGDDGINVLTGGAGDDMIDGGGGDDIFAGVNGGNAGNDEIHGGTGSDLVVYSGYWLNYDIVDNGDGTVTVKDLRDGSPDGTDTLFDVETMSFLNDGSIPTQSYPMSAAVNQAPMAEEDEGAVVEAGAVTYGTPSVYGYALTNDDDVNLAYPSLGESLTLTGVRYGAVDDDGEFTAPYGPTLIQGTYGALEITSFGNYHYDLDNNLAATQALVSGQTVEEIFTYEVTDAHGLTATAQIVIKVMGADDSFPDAVPDSITTDEATTATGYLLINDQPGTGGPTSVIAVNGVTASVGQQITLASGAKLTVNTNGGYSYGPNGKFNYLSDGSGGATNTSATDSFTYTVNGGDTATVTVTINGLASAGDVLGGNSGANDITGTTGGDLFNLSQGGDDKAHGLGGNDGFYFGATMTGADEVDGGAGTLDQIGLQGNYLGGNALTLGANGAVGVEMMILLPGSNTAFGDTSGAFYSYDVTTVDANVGAGQTFVVNANTLRAGENLTFNGAAELDGTFLTYGGLGNDHLTGGQKVDGFFFGDGGRFGSGDTVDGQGQGVGQLDQLGLQGNYSGANAIAFGASQITNIEMIVLLSGTDTRFGGTGSNYSFDITMNDGNVASGQKMIINANTLVVAESVTFNGGAESNGYFQIFGGNGNDSYIGSQGNDDIWGGGGADTITGGLGADTLHGGAGDDIFRYTSTAHSTAVSMDSILDFATGDKVDVSAIDAIAGGADDAFSFVGAAAFTGTGTAELQAVNTGGNNWTVSADVDGNGSADLVIAMTVTDAHSLTGADFVL